MLPLTKSTRTTVLTSLLRACTLVLPLPSIFAYRWPSQQYDALEALLYEGKRADGASLSSLQHPCKLRSDTGTSIGAEWLRLAYHDSATHDAEQGTGGLDASIVFELDRAENLGDGMNRSLADFESFSNKYVSRADVIALGTVFAVASCGGPLLSFSGGRRDATAAGPTGVPEVDQDLAIHTAMFQRQGFSRSEMIALVACGHTLGGVRRADFPLIFPSNINANTSVLTFDTSHDFDNKIVIEYLDGTTLNPLVRSNESTFNSDLRIFAGDGNATMQSLVVADDFSRVCSSLLEKMINMVPRNVLLTEPIDLLPEKLTSASLTLEHGKLVFKASLRLVQRSGSSAWKEQFATLFWCNRYGPHKDCVTQTNYAEATRRSLLDESDVSPITQSLGYFFLYFDFVVPIDPETSISMFWFEVSEEGSGMEATRYDNNSTGYNYAQDMLLYVPELSSVKLHGIEDTSKTFHFVVAVKSDIHPSRVHGRAFDNAMKPYHPSVNVTISFELDHSLPTTSRYKLYSAVVEDNGSQLTLDVFMELNETIYSLDFQPTYLLGDDVPYTPPSKVNISMTASKPSQLSTSDRVLDTLTGSCHIRIWLYVLQSLMIIFLS